MMKVWFCTLILLGTGLLAQAEEIPLPEQAVCVRCAALEGTSVPEPVVAAYEYQDSVYYFCSVECYEEFKRDPEAVLAMANTPPPEWATAIPS